MRVNAVLTRAAIHKNRILFAPTKRIDELPACDAFVALLVRNARLWNELDGKS